MWLTLAIATCVPITGAVGCASGEGGEGDAQIELDASTVADPPDAAPERTRFPGPCAIVGDIDLDGVANQRWRYAYDGRDWMSYATYDGEDDGVVDVSWEYLRDDDGRLLVMFRYDGEGTRVLRWDYRYDPDGRLVAASADDGADGNVDREARYLYTDEGLLQMFEIDRDRDGGWDQRWTYHHDDQVFLTAVDYDDQIDGVLEHREVYINDAHGNATQMLLDLQADDTTDQRRTYDYSCW